MTRKKNNRSLWILLAAIAVVAMAIFLLPSCSAKTPKDTLVSVGQQAPDFTVEMLDGAHITLSGLEGKVVLLNFWATWCPPCRAELKRVQTDLIDRFAGRDFVFLPISRGEQRQTVETFRTQTGYTFPMGLDPDQTIYARYATNYIPRNFLIDREGRIVQIEVGYTPAEFDALVQTIETELQKQ